jgi:hypothetical protein
MIDHPITRAFVTAAVLLAVVWGYFASPVLEYANAAWLAMGGLALGVGAGGGWLALHGNFGKRWEYPMIALGILGGVSVLVQTNVAMADYETNRSRCARLERDMLSARPVRPDGPALFEALRCVPQGNAPLQLVSPEKQLSKT